LFCCLGKFRSWYSDAGFRCAVFGQIGIYSGVVRLSVVSGVVWVDFFKKKQEKKFFLHGHSGPITM
jgi:hypothetical protein